MSEKYNNTKEIILQGKYALDGKDLNIHFNKDERWVMKNALRELNQKRLKNNPVIKKLKQGCKVGEGLWVCGYCQKKVRRLTSAHVGEPVCKIIDRILDEHFPQKTLSELYFILRREHNNIKIVICCDACNKLLEEN